MQKSPFFTESKKSYLQYLHYLQNKKSLLNKDFQYVGKVKMYVGNVGTCR